MEHSDEDLYFRYHRSGDLQAFNQLYERYKGALYRFILRMIGNSATAEEVFQEVWASLIKSNQYRQGPGSFKTFVYTIARNKAIDHYRRNRIQLVSDAYVQEE
ncbi:MAG: sigma-70 family RNA polymerase sigma factor, partial [Gammaproteobacteria bacterium]|nr:sigma-70 family RNA polymerase sigma factor [Gammaproteobacteria bacterium]